MWRCRIKYLGKELPSRLWAGTGAGAGAGAAAESAVVCLLSTKTCSKA